MRYKLPRGKFYGQPLMRKDVAGLILTETIYAPELIIDEHCHESAFFCLILKGTYTEVYENQIRLCKPLSLVFHPSNEIHSNRIHQAGTREFQIEFGQDWTRRIPDTTVLQHPAEFSDGRLPLVAMQLYREFHVSDDISNLAIEALMLELMVLTLRTGTKSDQHGKPFWLVRTEKLIHEHYTERLSVNELADLVHVHPVHLAAEFRKHHQRNIGDYVRDLRIGKACQQLVSSSKSLSDVALEVGFYDQSHFSRTFKQTMGVTPAQYRRQVP
jgi:AraC family transcriptional regulator